MKQLTRLLEESTLAKQKHDFQHHLTHSSSCSLIHQQVHGNVYSSTATHTGVCFAIS